MISLNNISLIIVKNNMIDSLIHQIVQCSVCVPFIDHDFFLLNFPLNKDFSGSSNVLNCREKRIPYLVEDFIGLITLKMEHNVC